MEMGISRLNSMYNFHDSTMGSLAYDANRNLVSMRIDVSRYMQKDYTDGEEGFIPIVLRFKPAESFSIPVEYSEDDSILDQEIVDGVLTLTLESDKTGDCYSLPIKSDSIEMEYL